MRNIYRVYGCLVGSLPAQPQQNVAFSLPVLLSGEEAHVLVSIGMEGSARCVFFKRMPL